MLPFASLKSQHKMLLDDSLKKIERGQHSVTTLTCFKEHFYHKLNLPLDEVLVHAFLSTCALNISESSSEQRSSF